MYTIYTCRMKRVTAVIISTLSFLTTPTLASTAHAANFFCPAVQPLPVTLGLHGHNPNQPQLRVLQSYLTNLRSITAAYQNARSNGGRNQITNCLMEHLAALADGDALLAPVTRADASTWELVRAEALNTLTITYPNLRFKPELPFIQRWLTTLPAPLPSPSIASR